MMLELSVPFIKARPVVSTFPFSPAQALRTGPMVATFSLAPIFLGTIGHVLSKPDLWFPCSFVVQIINAIL